MSRARSKAARLNQIERLLLAHPEGLRKAEIARRCKIHRSTVGRNLTDLGEEGVPLWEDDEGRIGIDREGYLTNIRLNLHECMAVYLAARLLARYSDKPNHHTAEALQKLGLSLEKSAPSIGQHIVQTSEALHTDTRPAQPGYMEVLETLTRSWCLGRKVRLWHQTLHGRKVQEYLFAPYFLEPSAVGYATYAIGHSDPPGALRTFKLERIRRAELTEESYQIPKGFDPAELLKSAWGIWYGEEELTEVRLRFSPRVARRLKESTWHPSEQVEDTEDGGCIWTSYVAEMQEMVPWIRGWGADCEVLAPPELRDMITGEARRLARIYGWAVHREGKHAHGEGVQEDHHFFKDFFSE